MKTNDEILKEMVAGCFNLNVNLNDTFYYACADSENISSDDFLDLLPIAKKYGTYKTMQAYCAVKRELFTNEKNLIPIWITRGDKKDKVDYKKAKEEILNHVRYFDSDLFVDLSFDLREKEKELNEFGENISWTSAKQKTGLIVQVASLLEQKIYGVGSCRQDAIEDLRVKLKEIKSGSN